MTTTIKTTCPYCGVGCGVLATPGGNGGVKIEGDPDHPANFGRLCSKGSALGETLGLDGRLLEPVINGDPASWESALDAVAGAFSQAIRDHGPDSVAIYGSGQLLTEDYYVANKLMKGFIGSANMDTNSRLCMASTVAGHKSTFGADTVPGTYEDLEEADTVVLVGSNLAWCHPVLYQRLQAAKEKRPNMVVINIDPRRTATSDIADLQLSIRPDGDVALFAGLLASLDRKGLIDRSYVQRFTGGIEQALAAVKTMDSQAVAEATGLSPDRISAFYDLWGQSERVVTVYSQGVNQSAEGVRKVQAILNCHLATGRIGRPGMGPFSVTGQPNAMGGREVGGLSNMLAAHMDLENPQHREAVQAFWKAPRIADKPGLKAVDLFEACHDGRIKALWILSTNPAVSMPNAERVREAIRRTPFVAVSEMTGESDTAKLAHVLLPAAGWGEKAGTVTNSERRISRQRAFLEAPGSARPDWRIMADVAQRMGFAEAFDYESPAEIFREHAALSAIAGAFGRDFDIGKLAGLSDADYRALPPTLWPAPASGPANARFFANGGFLTGDGRAQLHPTPGAIAMNAATLAEISGGRYILGLGASTRALAEGYHNQPFQRPAQKLLETTTEVRRLLDGQRANLDDGIESRALRMGQAPQPDLPIIIAAMGPKSIRVMVECADGWFPYYVTRDRFDTRTPEILAMRRAAGRGDAAFDVLSGPTVAVSEDIGEARGLVAANVAWYVAAMGGVYANSLRAEGYGAEVDAVMAANPKPSPKTAIVPTEAEALLDQLTAFGPPDQVQTALAKWDARVDVTMVGVTPGAPWSQIEAILHAGAPPTV